MPPKKKKGKKKKKKQDGELTADDKYKKTLDEIEALKDHLAVRKDLARRSQSHGEEWKQRMQDAEGNLEQQREDGKAVGAEMTRQYKTMQTELKVHIHQLETELARTRAQLDHTDDELKTTKSEMADMRKNKDLEIEMLQQTIKTMGDKYMKIFLDNLDSFKEQISTEEEKKWSKKARLIQEGNKQTLLEFGLHHLHI